MPVFDAVLFDLLTALLDSWTLWNGIAGSVEAGRKWRTAYLRLTYGCGTYQPYEKLVRKAAEEVGLGAECTERLVSCWDELRPWDDANTLLTSLAGRVPIGVVTNCSEVLGRRAVRQIGVPLDVVVTAERAGYYKPDPRPYRMALSELSLTPERVVFVAGSGFDLIGTAAVGMATLWHNRAGIARPPQAPAPLAERRTLRELTVLLP